MADLWILQSDWRQAFSPMQNQESFISEIKWAPIKSLFWNFKVYCKVKDFYSKRSFFVRQTLLLCRIMTAIANAENLQQYKKREQILALTSSTNLLREIKSSNFQQIGWRCLILWNALIWTDRSILSLNFYPLSAKGLNKPTLYSNNCSFTSVKYL